MLSHTIRSFSRRLASFSKWAGPLTDVSKLRYQAVFIIGAGGSGKSYVSHKWLKYMPGGGSGGVSNRGDFEEKIQQEMSEQERSLSNLQFQKSVDRIKAMGFKVELHTNRSLRMPFRLYEYDHRGQEHLIPPEEWKEELPPKVFREVEGLREVIFGTPVHEMPTYWRVVNPDLYKEELAGYLETQPGYVHEMSSEMSKAYFEAALDSGDPVIIDGTGKNLGKMVAQIQKAKAKGYKTSVVMVWVPLTVNHIRNATRARNVDPNMVTRQWKVISSNYAKLRSLADKAHFIDNRFDKGDFSLYAKEAEKVNNFIQRKTSYDSLYDLIAAESPSELRKYGKMLSQN